MSVLEKLIAAIPELKQDSNTLNEDPRYVRKLSELTGGALQKNCDVMQLPNGDVVVAEVKTMFYNYSWDADKGKFMRTKAVRKRKSGDDNVTSYEAEDVSDETDVVADIPVKRARAREEERVLETA